MPRVTHFEFGAAEPQRAAKFYHDVFGWQVYTFPGHEDYCVLVTGSDDEHGIDGGVMRHKDSAPRTVITIEVDSLDSYAESVALNGGKVVVPKMCVTGVGYRMFCTDTEGNLFGVHQPDPNAA